MKILADQNIPCVQEAFADLGELRLMPGREITARHLRDCHCLITRTVTRVNAELLADSPVEFVGTATIGMDHLDLDYLDNAGISYANAAGCNAESAAEYVISGLFALSQRRDFDPLQLRAGIIGYGNVGSNLVAKLETLGVECLVCDPPLQKHGDTQREFVSLDNILHDCDFISLHVPLTHSGEHPTHHLFDAERLDQLTGHCILVNAARGEVIDNAALFDLLQRRQDLCVFLDTWENEPQISRKLLQRVDLATPHIAGYSVEGRLRGTQMVLDAACAYFALDATWQMQQQLPPGKQLDCRGFRRGSGFWQDLFAAHCDIHRDHDALLKGFALNDDRLGKTFDDLRRVYQDRLEYSRFELNINPQATVAQQLQQLGFNLKR